MEYNMSNQVTCEGCVFFTPLDLPKGYCTYWDVESTIIDKSRQSESCDEEE